MTARLSDRYEDTYAEMLASVARTPRITPRELSLFWPKVGRRVRRRHADRRSSGERLDRQVGPRRRRGSSGARPRRPRDCGRNRERLSDGLGPRPLEAWGRRLRHGSQPVLGHCPGSSGCHRPTIRVGTGRAISHGPISQRSQSGPRATRHGACGRASWRWELDCSPTRSMSLHGDV